LARAGEWDAAAEFFEQVCKICPQSRWDELARAQLAAIRARAPRASDVGAEAEEAPQDQAGSADGPDAESVADGIAAAADEALANGNFDQAVGMAALALILDPQCDDAYDTLARIYQMRQWARASCDNGRECGSAKRRRPETPDESADVFFVFRNVLSGEPQRSVAAPNGSAIRARR
jgi:hypothetical protein